MAMDRIKPQTLKLVVDDNKTIDVKTESKQNAELNKALLDPVKFGEFAKNPKEFAAQYGLTIDSDISDQLVKRLDGIDSLDKLREYVNSIDPNATVWAVAQGAYSIASSKIAVAF